MGNQPETGLQNLPDQGSACPGFLRALLMADGTVTKLLQAYFQEAIQVCLQQQNVQSLSVTDSQAMGLPVRDSYLYRSILLRGKNSQRVYLHAESWIDLSAFAAEVQQAFLAAELGIGEILQLFHLATYRQISKIFTEQHAENPAYTRYYTRSYAIYLTEPCIHITERFPLETYLKS